MTPNQRLWVAGGVVLTGVLLLSGGPGDAPRGEREEAPRGAREEATRGAREEAARCEVEVTADVLNVRSGAGPGYRVLDQLSGGDTVEATRTTRNGFRLLGHGRWAAAPFLAVTEGGGCR